MFFFRYRDGRLEVWIGDGACGAFRCPSGSGAGPWSGQSIEFFVVRTMARFVGKVQLVLEGLDGVDCLERIDTWPEAIGRYRWDIWLAFQ